MADDEDRLRVDGVALGEFIDDLADGRAAADEAQSAARGDEHPTPFGAEFDDLPIAVAFEEKILGTAGPVEGNDEGNGFLGVEAFGDEQPARGARFAGGDAEPELAGAVVGEVRFRLFTECDDLSEFAQQFSCGDVRFLNRPFRQLRDRFDPI